MTHKNNRPGDAAEIGKRAEEIALEKASQLPEDMESLSSEEMREKLHELRVHQIELELQNDELLRVQSELDIARERYFDFYNLAPVGFCTISKQGLIIETNLATTAMLGETSAAIINQPLTRFIHKEDQDVYYLCRKQLFESGGIQEFDLRMVKNDGTTFWAHMMATAAQMGKSTPEYRVMMSDVSERKKAEAALKETERAQLELLNKLNEAQQIAKIGSWEWDLQTHHIWWSDECYRIFGVTQQDFVPRFEANGKFIHPDDFERYVKSFEHSFQTGEPLDINVKLIANDGLLKYCHAKGKIICDDSGQPIRFIGTLMDISERISSDNVLQETLKRLNTVISLAQDAIVMMDENGNISLWNE